MRWHIVDAASNSLCSPADVDGPIRQIGRRRWAHAVTEAVNRWRMAESAAEQGPERLQNSNPQALNKGLARMIWTYPSRYRRPQRGPAAAMMAADAH
jgi:hypothetical protein